ncbi:ABC transporter substrate-binding protein [Tropicibacter sp. Alg240-R139]|uniref:ABC transporter substrate-binding protein n=1 Tax=Tropicibacter sp. Alg240-R139 TaxID=2305991 RepID=UPI0013DFE01B|nr:ABC transporter substrate-binding protein [Tropicibacter sp. Alg240-R139]
MRYLGLALALLITPLSAAGFEVEDHARFGPSDAAQVVRVISTGDIPVFSPAIAKFLELNPDVAVDYTVASSTQLMLALNKEGAEFDVAISSAMDLQTKLANDGRTRRHQSAATETLPAWAKWRDNLFAFTQEPAAIVLSRSAFDGLDMPQTRQDLIAILRQHPERFRGRIGTYDLRASGLGYLFATQDARTSETFWRLTEVMGGLDARLYCCSSQMIDDVASGDLAVAYNVLGSYAKAREDLTRFEVVLPADFTTVMLRTALIPSASEQPELAGQFIDHLLEVAWSETPLESYPFTPINQNRGEADASLRRIRMGPGLLVYLDQFKKRSFLNEWESAILQP